MPNERYRRPTFEERKAEEKRIEEENKKRIALERSDLKVVLSIPEGRRFIWRLIEYGKVYHSIWDNSALIHKNEGRRQFGLKIFADIAKANPELAFKMALESLEKLPDNEFD